MYKPLVLAMALTGFAASAPVLADVLLIERAEQAQRAALPANGLTMSQVEARFGAPLEKLPPVAGNKPQHPPITRWNYTNFSVYFEHSRVISAVLNPTTSVVDRR